MTPNIKMVIVVMDHQVRKGTTEKVVSNILLIVKFRTFINVRTEELNCYS